MCGLHLLKIGMGYIHIVPLQRALLQIHHDCGAFCDALCFQLSWHRLSYLPCCGIVNGKESEYSLIETIIMAVVSCILSDSSKYPMTMHLLQCQWLVSASYQFDLHMVYIPCKLNLKANALSRNSLPFFCLSFHKTFIARYTSLPSR